MGGGNSGNSAPPAVWTWDGYLPRPPPPPRKCGQSENITFRHPSDAGGKNTTVHDTIKH